MTAAGPPPGSNEWVLTLAFLRFGADTRACRVLKALAARDAPPPADLIERLAAALGLGPAERLGQIEEAGARAREALANGASAGLRLIPWVHPDYPPLLAEICDPPVALWIAGEARALSLPAVAIVGSRRAAPTGIRIARALGRGLAEAGLSVVSGLARGIDAAAHEGALDAGGTSVGVLGSGADIVYPPEHRALAARLRQAGAVISEFPPGTPPRAHHFPLRNRIISGLCRAVVVIEASERSGSLITARMALEQGREVLAVPGTIASGQHAGCHALIKDGAALVETVGDVLTSIRWSGASQVTSTYAVKSKHLSALETAMAAGEPYTLDELAAQTGLSAAALLSELGLLEIAGIVGRLPGAGFVKFDKSVIGERNG